MERVEALVQKLNTQLAQKEPKSNLKHTLLELLTELEEPNDFTNLPNNVSVLMPFASGLEELVDTSMIQLVTSKPDELTLLQKPTQLMASEVQEPVKKEIMDQLALEPIKDLRAAIGINDKFLFIEALFMGDEKAFEASIKTINAFTVLAEAQYWIKKELSIKNNWVEDTAAVNQLDQLVKRRFS